MAGEGGLSAHLAPIVAAVDAALPPAPCVVALSGGADSAVCAWAAKQAGRTVRAVSVDHRLEAADLLMESAAAIAGTLGLSHTVVAAPAEPTEDALRVARYASLEATAGDDEVIALGHTADDQVETVLAHLLRGSGAAGAAGMPATRGRFIRPLLSIRRADVRAAASGLGLPFADDPANLDRQMLRNRIRHDVLPALRTDINPAVDDALLRAAGHFAADEAELDRRAAQVPLRSLGSEVWIPAGVLSTMPAAVAARVVRRALRQVLDPYPGSEGDVSNVLAVGAGVAPSLPLVGDHLASRDGPWVAIHPAGPPSVPGPVSLDVPGTARFGRWTIHATSGPAAPLPVGRRRAVVALDPALRPTVRGAQPGDRLPIEVGSKPVVDLLREAGVPARLRPGWPVVEVGGRMIWIAGVRAAAGAAPLSTGSMVTLQLEEAR